MNALVMSYATDDAVTIGEATDTIGNGEYVEGGEA